MRRRSNYPLIIIRGRDMFQIAPAPNTQGRFTGFRNGRVAALGADAPAVLKTMLASPST